MTSDEFEELALSFPGTVANPRFDRTAFKVEGKRIFTTLHAPSQSVNIKLSLVDQSVFCEYDAAIVYPVPNKWGLQGWTTFDLIKVPRELLLDALDAAYKEVFKKK